MVKLSSLIDWLGVDQVRKSTSNFKPVSIDGSKVDPLVLRALGFQHAPKKIKGYTYAPISNRPSVFNMVPL